MNDPHDPATDGAAQRPASMEGEAARIGKAVAGQAGIDDATLGNARHGARTDNAAIDSAVIDSAAVDKAAWREGFQVGLPTLFGIGAWGVVVGVAMIKSGLSLPQALGMTLLVFAGSAQLASLPLIAANAPIWVVFVTALVINLRFVIFSALLAPHFATLRWPRRLWLGFVSGDISTALFLQRYPDPVPAPGKLAFLKGLLYPNWVAWQAGSIAGILLGNAVPTEWGLGFAGTLAIVCILVPMVASRPALCGVLVAAAVSVAAAGLPFKLGLLAAVLVGMVTAMMVEETGDRLRARRAPGGEGGHV